MPDSRSDDTFDAFERGLTRSKKGLKRIARRLEGPQARATFAGLAAERREAMRIAGASIDHQIEALRKALKSALRLGDTEGGG